MHTKCGKDWSGQIRKGNGSGKENSKNRRGWKTLTGVVFGAETA